VSLKFLDKYMGGELASVVGIMQVTWYPSGQWSTERLDPTKLIRLRHDALQLAA